MLAENEVCFSYSGNLLKRNKGIVMSMIHRYSSVHPPLSSPPSPFIRKEPRLPHKYLWGGFGFGIFIVLVSVMLYFCIRRHFFGIFKRRWKQDILQRAKINIRHFQLMELEKATKNFSRECLLGSGAFGNVYRGTFEDATLAIKKAHASSYQSVKEFRNEVELLSRVNHRNLLGLVGFCEDSGQRILVYEYVPNGSLFEYIAGRRDRTLTWRQRVNIAIGAAKGIAYLHEDIKTSIIHRDLKPSNILIGDGFEAKVSDFGLVKSGPVDGASHVSSQIKGTPGYLDPAYCSTLHLTPFSDVYSFGVILLQLVTAKPAVDKTRSHSQYHVIEWARPSLEQGNVEDILDADLLRGECNTEMMLKMGQLGLRCVVKVPKQRPTMSQIWQELEEALHSTESFIHKQLSRDPTEHDDSQSYVSIDGVQLQRFLVEVEGLSFNSTNMRCLEVNSISIDIGEHRLEGINEECPIQTEAPVQ